MDYIGCLIDAAEIVALIGVLFCAGCIAESLIADLIDIIRYRLESKHNQGH